MKMNIKNIIKCQRNKAFRSLWLFIQNRKRLQMFMFLHMRKAYTSLRYFCCFENTINLNAPLSFHEKLFWLSLNWRHPLIVKCADKFTVREYVNDCGCGDILNQIFGVYNNSDEIDFSRLPKMFVLKSNRGSGDNFFCTDKSSINKECIVNLVDSWRQNIHGIDSAEYQYYPMPFKIICEKHLMESASSFIEYQLFCFNGQPHSFLARTDLETRAGTEQFAVSYSLDWKRLYLRKDEERISVDLPEPCNRGKMIDYAKRLSNPFPHVRVDFYEVDGRLYFGEMTFSSHGNLLNNYKEESLEEWNKLLILPKPYRNKDRY